MGPLAASAPPLIVKWNHFPPWEFEVETRLVPHSQWSAVKLWCNKVTQITCHLSWDRILEELWRSFSWDSSAASSVKDSDKDHKQRCHRRPAEGLETTSRSSSTNVAAYNRKRPETTEPGSVVCPAQSIWSWTVAWNRGNGNALAGACYMMMIWRSLAQAKLAQNKTRSQTHSSSNSSVTGLSRSDGQDHWLLILLHHLMFAKAQHQLICVRSALFFNQRLPWLKR